MFQYLVPITKNIGINTFSCKTSRESNHLRDPGMEVCEWYG